ncbi:MAG: hypothetical protein IPI73_28885 [Betaproteobacteria bacterium]|nr:hypothetical protein [Betaproteobacteria bacterium]
MVAEITAMAGADSAVLDHTRVLGLVMNKVPRHEFVLESQQLYAYENRSPPIGHGVDHLQPFIVAAMTELMKLKPGDTVAGKSAPVPATSLGGVRTAQSVYTIEVVEPLAQQATEGGAGGLIRACGPAPATVISAGPWRPGPFDAIMVRRRRPRVPPPLLTA